MLSTLPMFDGGSHNAMDGTYCLRLQTRPRAGGRGRAPGNSLTFRKAGKIRVEFWFTLSPKPAR